MYRPRVVIADDHALLHDALKKFLEDDCDVVACVRDGLALVDAVPCFKPDVVLLDIVLPLLNGLDAMTRLKDSGSTAKYIVVTGRKERHLVPDAFQRGASGYILKHSAPSELLVAIRQAWSGKSYLTPLIAEWWEDGVSPCKKEKSASELTPRQREILQLLGEGHSMKRAADLLGIRPRTIAFHKYRIMEEFGLRNSADVIQFALKQRLLYA